MISIGGSGGGGSGGVTLGNSSISHQGLVIGSGKDQVPVSEVADAVRFLAYLIKNHPEIKDAYTAFTAKERILR